MDHKKFKKHFGEYIETRKKLMKELDVLEILVGFTLESSLGKTIDLFDDAYLGLLIDLYEPANREWLKWFIFENNCGKCAWEAGKGDNMREIKTLDDLIWVMEL